MGIEKCQLITNEIVGCLDVFMGDFSRERR